MFIRFREIKHNPTEDYGTNKYFSPTLSPTVSENLFFWASDFVHISNLIRRSFLLG